MKPIEQNDWKYISGNGVSYEVNSKQETTTLTVDGNCSYMDIHNNGQDKLLLTSNAMIYNGTTVRDKSNSSPITIDDTLFVPSFNDNSASYTIHGY